VFYHEKKALQKIASNLRKKLPNRVLFVFAFGSRVRGDHDVWSDFDVLIVVDRKGRRIEDKIMDIIVREELKANIFFTPIIKERTAFELEKKYNTPFYRNIVNEGILL
jgi:predicted nucleotidyltransferase